LKDNKKPLRHLNGTIIHVKAIGFFR